MSWRRCRSQLNKKKKKVKKMDYYAKEAKTKEPKSLPPVQSEASRELEWAELRRKLKPLFFDIEVDDFILPNGDAICDTIKCTAFYELMSSVPVVHIVDVKYDNLTETKEFGELLNVAYEKITQKLGHASSVQRKQVVLGQEQSKYKVLLKWITGSQAGAPERYRIPPNATLFLLLYLFIGDTLDIGQKVQYIIIKLKVMRMNNNDKNGSKNL